MADETPLDPDRAAMLRARQKTSIIFSCSLLAVVGLAVLVLPLNKIPHPVRILMAAVDLIVASTLWLVARQKFKE